MKSFSILFLSLVVFSLLNGIKPQGSWDSFIASLVYQSNNSIDRATIISLDGGAKWTSDSSNYTLNPSEAEGKKISLLIKEDFHYTTFKKEGIFLEGIKYGYYFWNGSQIIARNYTHGYLTMQKTNLGLIIAHTPINYVVNHSFHTVSTFAEVMKENYGV